MISISWPSQTVSDCVWGVDRGAVRERKDISGTRNNMCKTQLDNTQGCAEASVLEVACGKKRGSGRGRPNCGGLVSQAEEFGLIW